MTPAGPLGAAVPAAAGLPGPAGATSATSAGQEFPDLVGQLLGRAAPSPATDPPVGDAPAAAGAPTDGTPASVPGPQTVAGAPLPGRAGDAPATDEEDAAPDEAPAGAAVPLGTLPPALLQAVLAASVAPAREVPVGAGPEPGTGRDGQVGQVGDAPAASDAAAVATDPAAPSLATPAPAPTATPSATAITPATAPTTVPGAVSVSHAEPPAPAPVTHQVLDEIIRVTGTGAGPRRVTVRLQPESLGEVRVVLSVRDGALRVNLAAGGAAHHTLLEGAPELQRLLEAAGSPDARIVVRDLPGVAATGTSPTPTASAPPPGSPGATPDPGAGQPGTGQPGGGQTPDRRTPEHGRSTAMDGTHDPANPPRRTESVTRTRTAGVDVTM